MRTTIAQRTAETIHEIRHIRAIAAGQQMREPLPPPVSVSGFLAGAEWQSYKGASAEFRSILCRFGDDLYVVSQCIADGEWSCKSTSNDAYLRSVAICAAQRRIAGNHEKRSAAVQTVKQTRFSSEWASIARACSRHCLQHPAARVTHRYIMDTLEAHDLGNVTIELSPYHVAAIKAVLAVAHLKGVSA